MAITPNPPQNIELVILSGNSIKLQWEKPEGTTVSIYRSLTQGFVPSEENLIQSGIDANFWIDANLQSNVKYYYRLTLTLFGITSNPSEEIVCEILAVIPNPPQNIDLVILSSNSIKLQWEKPEEATVNIYRSLTQGFVPSEENLIQSGIDANFWIDDNLRSNVKYYYRLTLTLNGFTSNPSEEIVCEILSKHGIVEEMKQFIVTQLETAMLSFPPDERLVVELPVSVDNYALNHPRGALLIVYRGSNYTSKGFAQLIAQNRDMEIGVIICARNLRRGKTPEDYLDFVIQSLSGIEIISKRGDRKIYCQEDEWLKEENGIWWYAATFIVPTEFWEEYESQ